MTAGEYIFAAAVLTKEGGRFFSGVTAGRAGNDLLFTHNGAPWGKSHQIRLMKHT